MSGQWEPGDVALVTGHGDVWRAIVRPRKAANGVLEFAYTTGGYDIVGDLAEGYDARPLVVIDPEDREAVERLIDLLDKHYGTTDEPTTSEDRRVLIAALREFANPTPPKPDEPQGLGAVVRDAEGKRWVGLGNTFAGGQRRWQSVEGLTFSTYRTIDAVEVLSEGVIA